MKIRVLTFAAALVITVTSGLTAAENTTAPSTGISYPTGWQDWAAIAVMDVNRDFSTEYEQLLLLALHKNNASDAYVIILFDDYAAVKPEINSLLASLRFK